MNRTVDRRWFIKAAAAAAVFLPLAAAVRPAGARATKRRTRPNARGFRFMHDDSVAILLDFAAREDRYDLTVRRGGENVEFFPDAHPRRLHRLGSEHFKVEYFDPLAGV